MTRQRQLLRLCVCVCERERERERYELRFKEKGHNRTNVGRGRDKVRRKLDPTVETFAADERRLRKRERVNWTEKKKEKDLGEVIDRDKKSFTSVTRWLDYFSIFGH